MKTQIKIYILLFSLICILSAGVATSVFTRQQPAPTPTSQTTHTSPAGSESKATTEPPAFVAPLHAAHERVTKKPFGIRISPSHSPVDPEKFTGIHTGTDFEIFPEEAEIEVPVTSICAGPLLRKQQARGYGGMVVQACTLNGNPITVVYGHLKLASIPWSVGALLAQGDRLGLLGQGFSPETDGERKHLHLGIHAGPEVITNGYISRQAELQNWINLMDYIR